MEVYGTNGLLCTTKSLRQALMRQNLRLLRCHNVGPLRHDGPD